LIYNIDKRVQEDHLQNISVFSEYANCVLKHNNTNDESMEHPFQSLDILIRDYQGFEDITSQNYKEYMDDYLNKKILFDKKDSDLNETRFKIKSSFNRINCFLLPHPGLVVIGKKFDGAVSKLSFEFQKYVKLYIDSIVESIQPKKIDSADISADGICVFLENYVNIFNDTNAMPKPQTLLQATVDSQLKTSLLKSLKAYRKEMKDLINSESAYIPESKVKQYHDKIMERSIVLFNKSATIGSKEEIDEMAQMMNGEITTMYATYHDFNRERNPYRYLNQYILPLQISIISYFVKAVMDVSCTGYLEVCTQLSILCGLLYSLILLGLMTMLAMKFYNKIN